jgi:hypothetical protein
MAQQNIQHHVTHITQMDQNYCWACALAMVLGRHSWQAALEIPDRCVRGRAADGSLLPAGVPAAASALGLSCTAVTSFTPAILAGRMQRSAAAVFGSYRQGGRTLNHAMVVSMLRGDDANATSVQVGVDDPWANGSRWVGGFLAFSGPTLVRADYIVSR